MTDKETQRQADEARLDELVELDIEDYELDPKEPYMSIMIKDRDFLLSMARKGLDADRYRDTLEEIKEMSDDYIDVPEEFADGILAVATRALEEAKRESKQ